MKRFSFIIIAAFTLCMVSCKPTENNYRAAYDAAQKKKQAGTSSDADMVLPAGVMQRFGDPVRKEVDGESVNIVRDYIRYEGGTENAMLRWNVAVAKYKMPTNCAAQTERLISEGFKAFYVKNREGSYYVVAASFDTVEEAARFIRDYSKKHEASTFIGLPGAPVLIEK